MPKLQKQSFQVKQNPQKVSPGENFPRGSCTPVCSPNELLDLRKNELDIGTGSPAEDQFSRTSNAECSPVCSPNLERTSTDQYKRQSPANEPVPQGKVLDPICSPVCSPVKSTGSSRPESSSGIGPGIPENVQSSSANKPYLKTTDMRGVRASIFDKGLECRPTREKRYFGKIEPPERDRIFGFSKKSRVRLFRMLSKIHTKRLSEPLFVTLTYHFANPTNISPEASKGHLNAFLQLLRVKWPGFHYVWRLELQKRGVPHYHLILWFPGHFNTKETSFQAYIKIAWNRIADPKSKKHLVYGTQIEHMNNYKKVVNYMSKYLAKETQEKENVYGGRRWGNDYDMPIDAHAEIYLNSFEYSILRRYLKRWVKSISKNSLKYFKFFDQRQNMFKNQYYYLDSRNLYRLLMFIKGKNLHLSYLLYGKDPPFRNLYQEYLSQSDWDHNYWHNQDLVWEVIRRESENDNYNFQMRNRLIGDFIDGRNRQN